MSDSPAFLDRMKRGASELAALVRPGHVAAAAVVVAIGVGVAGLGAVALPGPRPVLDGDRMQIQVVDPVEPEIQPGSVMDVGELVDGFEYTPPPRAVPEPAGWTPWDVGFGDVSSPRPSSRDRDERAVLSPPPQPEAPADDRRDSRDSRVARWFGFDAPDRDYRAEREARRARQEAREDEERARAREQDWREQDWRRDQGRDREVARYRDRDGREVRRYSSEGPDRRWD